jgi:hypothetical protein
MKKRLSTVAAVFSGLSLAGVSLSSVAQDAGQGQAEEKVTIKQVMKEAHKDGLLAKVLKEEATPEEKLKLLDLYVSMAEAKPPQGDEKVWTERTADIVLKVARVVVEREGAAADLKKSTDCAACHKEFKPPAK